MFNCWTDNSLTLLHIYKFRFCLISIISHDAMLQILVHYICEFLYLGLGVWGCACALQPWVSPLTPLQPDARVLWSALDQGTFGLSFADLLSMRRYPLAKISIFLITNEISHPRISASVFLLGACAPRSAVCAFSASSPFYARDSQTCLLSVLTLGPWLSAPLGRQPETGGSVESERQAFKIVFYGEMAAQLCLFQEENHVSKDRW